MLGDKGFEPMNTVIIKRMKRQMKFSECIEWNEIK